MTIVILLSLAAAIAGTIVMFSIARQMGMLEGPRWRQEREQLVSKAELEHAKALVANRCVHPADQVEEVKLKDGEVVAKLCLKCNEQLASTFAPPVYQPMNLTPVVYTGEGPPPETVNGQPVMWYEHRGDDKTISHTGYVEPGELHECRGACGKTIPSSELLCKFCFTNYRDKHKGFYTKAAKDAWSSGDNAETLAEQIEDYRPDWPMTPPGMTRYELIKWIDLRTLADCQACADKYTPCKVEIATRTDAPGRVVFLRECSSHDYW